QRSDSTDSSPIWNHISKQRFVFHLYHQSSKKLLVGLEQLEVVVCLDCCRSPTVAFSIAPQSRCNRESSGHQGLNLCILNGQNGMAGGRKDLVSQGQTQANSTSDSASRNVSVFHNFPLSLTANLSKSGACDDGRIVLVNVILVNVSRNSRNSRLAGVLPHPVATSGTLSGVICNPQIKLAQSVHIQLGVCVIGVGVHHSIHSPRLNGICRIGHQIGQRRSTQRFQLIVLDIHGDREFKSLASKSLFQLGMLFIVCCLILRVSVVINTNGDSQPLTLAVVAFKLGVNVDAAEALIGGYR